MNEKSIPNLYTRTQEEQKRLYGRIMYLHEHMGLKRRHIAERLSIPPTTIESLKMMAKKKGW